LPEQATSALFALNKLQVLLPRSGKMRRTRFGGLDLSTALVGLLMISFCYAAWLTSIVFCAANGARPLLIAAAAFFPIGIIHGIGVWFGGW
jgi:hypothetical protein